MKTENLDQHINIINSFGKKKVDRKKEKGFNDHISVYPMIFFMLGLTILAFYSIAESYVNKSHHGYNKETIDYLYRENDNMHHIGAMHVIPEVNHRYTDIKS